MKTSFSITPNTKITQYLERKKNVVNHKSPSNALNKSQNIRENKRIPKINLKNYIINKRLNKKKMIQIFLTKICLNFYYIVVMTIL